MSITLRQSELEEAIRDPAFGLWMLTGVELDTFQSAALKTMWFTKEVIDSSAINTGKTFRLIGWCILRAVLLPNPPSFRYPGRLIGAFYQEKGSVAEIFVKEMDAMISLPGAGLLRRELKRQVRGRLGYHEDENTINYHFRNGSCISAPALNVMRKSKTMAGRRYSDGYVEEYTQIDSDSDALDEQVLDRVNRVDFNPKHPVWSPHIILSAHAECPDSHPSYARIKQYRELIRNGSQDHALITSSSEDWSDRNPLFKVKREKALADRHRDSLKQGKAKVAQKHKGLWLAGGADWYDNDFRDHCLCMDILPESKAMPGALYALGWDTASSGGEKADWNAGVTCRAIPVTVRQLGQPGVMPFENGTYYHISFTHAIGALDKRSAECSGIIHTLHRWFGYSRIVMDGGGGGQMVKKDLWRSEQIIEGVMEQGVVGLCEWGMEHVYPSCLPIIQEFKPTAPRLLHTWDPGFTRGMDGLVDNMHRKMRDAFETRTVAWPATAEMRGAAGMRGMGRKEREAQEWLDRAWGQFGSVRIRAEKDGRAKLTSNGFHSFEAKGKRKKDLAYAALYAFIGIISLITDPEVGGGESADDEDMYSS